MNSHSPKTRNKKNGTEMENVVEEDMFYSKLSEPHLIGHILSFLPTRDAVRTSVLSKKWLDNWTFITKLDFNDCFYRDNNSYRICTHCKSKEYGAVYVSNKAGCDDLYLCEVCSKSEDALYNGGNSLRFSDLTKVKHGLKLREHFEQFVYNALLFTENNNSSISSMLERFSLVINNNHDVSHLNLWISCILKRRVKNLKIRSSVPNLPLFSASTSKSLLNSTQLEALELVLQNFTNINVPTNSIHFGHLKHLKLYGIYFTIDPSFDYLTLRLPVLKKFEISNCNWSNGKDIIIDASLLESISIKNLNELRGESIIFNALYLKEFNYCGYGRSHQINLSGCSLMPYTSVEIILKQSKNNISETRCFAFQLLQHLKQAKYLKFKVLKFGKQSKEDVYHVSALPVFANLSNMELCVVTIDVIFGLLQKLPVLKTLVLALKETRKFAKELLNFAVVPDCLTSTLQIVNFEKVKGDEQELFLAEFILKHGKRLERIGFSLSNQNLANTKAMKEFKEKLYSFKKDRSFDYILEFSYDSGSRYRSSDDDDESSDDNSSSDSSAESSDDDSSSPSDSSAESSDD